MSVARFGVLIGYAAARIAYGSRGSDTRYRYDCGMRSLSSKRAGAKAESESR